MARACDPSTWTARSTIGPAASDELPPGMVSAFDRLAPVLAALQPLPHDAWTGSLPFAMFEAGGIFGIAARLQEPL